MGRFRPVLSTALCAALLALAGPLVTGPLAAIDLSELEDGSVTKLTGLGNVELAQGRYESAIARYQQALEVDRTYFTALYNLGLAYHQLGQPDKATQWYTEALRIRPDHPEVLCNLGVLAFQAADFRTAADRFTAAARLPGQAPQDVADFWFNAGSALERLGDLPATERAYEECLATDGRHYGGHYNLGTLLLTTGASDPAKLRAAQSHLTTATTISPNRVEAWLNLALIHERTDAADPEADYDAALKAAEGTAGINQVRWQRASWLDRKQPPQKVAMREELRRILASDPAYPNANGLLGAYLYDIADFAGAVTHLSREVEGTEPSDPSAIRLESHFLLAVIYTDHQPDPVKALEHAQAYYKHRPDAAKIHELRRRALRLSGAMGVAVATSKPAKDTPEGKDKPEGEAPAAGQPAHGSVSTPHASDASASTSSHASAAPAHESAATPAAASAHTAPAAHH